ncbi:MAG: T9SS type A sorting domain-containing protein [Ignavibacteriae bacterium]|nr:T9SS C-terminal target domain-containing protein [Ignavibacteriota bacterium]NOG97650.1 T9SS type A sorting domain-containing protein [Ignavibacteriota bacterium]
MKINTLFFLIFLSIICLAQKEKTNEIQDTTDSTKAAIDINNIWLPLDNRGVLGDVPLGDSLIANGMYDDEVFLFSGGFYLSGYSSGDMWGNGIARTDRIEDYQPGLVGSSPDSSINLVYQIRSTDPPFGSTWQAWKDAVSLGAKFYDGNEDGVYNPIDLNSNGLWDVNEDKPDFQGDQTAWCVYNDGVTRENRIYDVGSQGIEIRQSVFASDGHGNMFDDIIFIRYEVTNTGSAADILDSVYFAAMADADLGDYLDDLASVDTVEQSGIAYNSGEDDDFGINPPAFFVKQLQGPPVFIPGETFIDNDSDGEFTSGIDTPLDSAVAKHGKYLGEYYIAGAINNPITAFTVYHGLPNYDHPNNPQALRNYLIGGLNTIGEPLDPCTWFVGNGSTLPNCNSINPRFMYSGDPVSGNGWMNIAPLDNIFVLSTGPFKLKIGEPVELIYAYIVGRGTDHLNSITKAREISQFVQMVYDNNFENLPTGIDDDKNLIADEFMLYQNYPNPFNPVTTIKYTIPALGVGNENFRSIQITIFDILGRKIKTLVSEQKPAGTYEVQFDASQLSSGVYFYQLSAGSFIQTKKLMLLK